MIGRAQRVVTSGTWSSWKSVIISVPQVLVLDPVLFKIFTNDLDEGIESIFKSANNTKLQGVADKMECCAATQQGLNRVESWGERNLMSFNKSVESGDKQSYASAQDRC